MYKYLPFNNMYVNRPAQQVYKLILKFERDFTEIVTSKSLKLSFLINKPS